MVFVLTGLWKLSAQPFSTYKWHCQSQHCLSGVLMSLGLVYEWNRNWSPTDHSSDNECVLKTLLYTFLGQIFEDFMPREHVDKPLWFHRTLGTQLAPLLNLILSLKSLLAFLVLSRLIILFISPYCGWRGREYPAAFCTAVFPSLTRNRQAINNTQKTRMSTV